MKAIFITGAAGYVGSNLIKFLKKNNSLYCLYRNKRPNIEDKNIKWVKGSLKSPLKKYLKKTDCVIHLACHSAYYPYDSYLNCIKTNVLESLDFLNEAYKNQVRKFIILGTGFEFGNYKNNKKKIPHYAELNPNNSYAYSKAEFSKICKFWTINKKISLKYLRVFYVYGNNEKKNRFFPSLIKALKNKKSFHMTNGKQVRDFLHIDQLCKILNYELIFKDNETNKTIYKNIGLNNISSLKNFAFKIAKENKSNTKILFSKKNRDNEIQYFVPLLKKKDLIKYKKLVR